MHYIFESHCEPERSTLELEERRGVRDIVCANPLWWAVGGVLVERERTSAHRFIPNESIDMVYLFNCGYLFKCRV